MAHDPSPVAGRGIPRPDRQRKKRMSLPVIMEAVKNILPSSSTLGNEQLQLTNLLEDVFPGEMDGRGIKIHAGDMGIKLFRKDKVIETVLYQVCRGAFSAPSPSHTLACPTPTFDMPGYPIVGRHHNIRHTGPGT